jgi:hypothetical protein
LPHTSAVTHPAERFHWLSADCRLRMPLHPSFSSCADFRQSWIFYHVSREKSTFSLQHTFAVTLPAGRLHWPLAAYLLHMPCTPPSPASSSCEYFQEVNAISQVSRQKSPISLLCTAAVSLLAGRRYCLTAGCRPRMPSHLHTSKKDEKAQCRAMCRRQAADSECNRAAGKVTADVRSKEKGDFCRRTWKMPSASRKWTKEEKVRWKGIVQAAGRRELIQSSGRKGDQRHAQQGN